MLVGRVSIASDNGLSPDRHQAFIWTTAGILLIGPLGTNFNEIWIKIQNFIHENVFENVVCEMAATLSRGEMSQSIPGSSTPAQPVHLQFRNP